MQKQNDLSVLNWIESELQPVACNSEDFFYNLMESQSYFTLPILYKPFDPDDPGHWMDRGDMFDYLHSTGGPGKKLLDFGPGDGWPSLIVAPSAREVIGVDGSPRRVEVCTKNAARLGITNARFLHVAPGSPLPFPNDTFDGVMAASSIEQSPDPHATLSELFRVLRPGGRLRIFYEALGIYQNGEEQTADLEVIDERACWLTIYDRDIPAETARMYRLRLAMPVEHVTTLFSEGKDQPLWNGISIPALERIRQSITESRICTLTHPSGRTFARWMEEIGFSEILPTHAGRWFALQLYQQLEEKDRPKDLQAIDRMLDPLVKIVVGLPAPWVLADGRDPMITAIK